MSKLILFLSFSLLCFPGSAQDFEPTHDEIIIMIEEVDSLFYNFYFKKNQIPNGIVKFLKEEYGQSFRLSNSRKRSLNSRKLSLAVNRGNMWIVGFEEETWGGYSIFHFLTFEEEVNEMYTICLGGHYINWYQLRDMIRRKEYSLIH